MYVPGKLKNCDKVIVDVGTGYYVEKVRFLVSSINYYTVITNQSLRIIYYVSVFT